MSQEERQSESKSASDQDQESNQAQNIEWRDPANLEPHPTNLEVYGDGPPDTDFISRVREAGETHQPLKIRPDNVILGGHRRWRAAKELDLDRIPVVVVDIAPDVDGRWRILELNDQRDKSFSDKMGEAELLDDLIEENDWSLQTFAGGEYDAWRDFIADRVGFGSGENYRKARTIWQARNSDDEVVRETAQREIQNLDSNDPDEQQSVHGAYQDVDRAKANVQYHEKIGWDEWQSVEDQLLVVESCDLVFEDMLDSLDGDDSHWQLLYELISAWSERIIDDTIDIRRVPPHISTMSVRGHSFARSYDGLGLPYVFSYLLEQANLVTHSNPSTADSFELASLVERKPSPDKLEELYWDDGQTYWQIAMLLGVHERLVEYWMWEEDIPIKRGVLSERTASEIDNLRETTA